MKKWVILLGMILLPFWAGAQTPEIQNFENLLAKTAADTARVDLLNKLAFAYIFQNSDTAHSYLKQALTLSQRIAYPKGEQDTYNVLGIVFRIEGLYEQAIQSHLASLKICEQIHDQQGIAYNLGNLGMIYLEQENYRQAIEQYEKALAMKEAMKDTISMAFTLNDLGAAHIKLGEYEKAIQYIQRSSEIHQSIGNKAYNQFSIGNIYLLMGKWDQAMKELEGALAYCKQEPNDFIEVQANCKMAEAYYAINSYEQALLHAQKSLRLAQKNSMKKDIRDAVLMLSKIYAGLQDYKNAYQNYNLFVAYQDTLNSVEVEKKTALLAAKYEYNQKESLLNATHEQERAKQKWIIGIGLIVLAFMGTVIVFVFRSRKKIARAYQKLEAAKTEITAKNEELQASEEEIRQGSEELMVVNERLTEEKIKAEEAFLALKETKQQMIQSEKMASLGLLTAGIAHEINNPLNFISGGAQGLKVIMNDLLALVDAYEALEGVHTEEEAQEFRQCIEKIKTKAGSGQELKEDAINLLLEIQKGIDRVTEIVLGLRNFSRTDYEHKITDSLHSNINNTLLILRNKFQGKVEIVRNFDPTIQNIDCLPGQLSQALMNILSNGADAIEGSGTITITTKNLGDKVQIAIKDTGIGMSESAQNKIFDPFFTTKGVGKGTGLGLSIVHGIVKKHQGSIDVYSELGKGTEFLITLPKQ